MSHCLRHLHVGIYLKYNYFPLLKKGKGAFVSFNSLPKLSVTLVKSFKNRRKVILSIQVFFVPRQYKYRQVSISLENFFESHLYSLPRG